MRKPLIILFILFYSVSFGQNFFWYGQNQSDYIPPADIVFVGYATGYATEDNYNIDLTDLNGIRTLMEGDIVLVATGDINNGVTPGVTTSGYTEIATLEAVQVYRSYAYYGWKIMGATPDVTVTCIGSGVNTVTSVGIAYVFRNVDTSTPLDVTSTTATGTGSCLINNPSITPSSAGSEIVILGAAGMNWEYSATPTTTPSGFSDGVYEEQHAPSLGNGQTIVCAHMSWSSGTVDPDAWGMSSTSNQQAWTAVTLVLRPKI